MRVRFGMLCALLAAVFIISSLDRAPAQSYPTRPITIIIPFPPGGNSDIIVRTLADRLSLVLRQPVIVDNRPGGAGGTVGAKAVANASPDGYTLLFTPAAPLVTAPVIYKNLGYDPFKSFTPVATVFSTPQMLVVNPTLPVNSIAQLASYAKANPGKVSFASPGFGTQPHPARGDVQADDGRQHCARSLQGCPATRHGLDRRASANVFRHGRTVSAAYSGRKSKAPCHSRRHAQRPPSGRANHGREWFSGAAGDLLGEHRCPDGHSCRYREHAQRVDQ